MIIFYHATLENPVFRLVLVMFLFCCNQRKNNETPPANLPTNIVNSWLFGWKTSFMFSTAVTTEVGRTANVEGYVYICALPMSTGEMGATQATWLVCCRSEESCWCLVKGDLSARHEQILPNLRHLLPVWHPVCDPPPCNSPSLWGS